MHDAAIRGLSIQRRILPSGLIRKTKTLTPPSWIRQTMAFNAMKNAIIDAGQSLKHRKMLPSAIAGHSQ